MSHKKHEDWHEHTKYDDICKIKKDLIENLKAEINMVGFDKMDTMETGQIIDMIKDLAEAEKSCMEACYYKKVVEAMEEAEEDPDGRMGYNTRRYANGRYAPKGRGTRMGYIPEMGMMNPYLYDPDFEEEMERGRLGYQGGNRGRGDGYQSSGAGNRSQSGSRMGYDMDWDPDDDPKQSREYNEYKRAKRHYSETKSPEDKRKMDEHAMKHVNQTMDSFREMWRDADPNMRKRMKADLTTLVGEMPT